MWTRLAPLIWLKRGGRWEATKRGNTHGGALALGEAATAKLLIFIEERRNALAERFSGPRAQDGKGAAGQGRQLFNSRGGTKSGQTAGLRTRKCCCEDSSVKSRKMTNKKKRTGGVYTMRRSAKS